MASLDTDPRSILINRDFLPFFNVKMLNETKATGEDPRTIGAAAAEQQAAAAAQGEAKKEQQHY